MEHRTGDVTHLSHEVHACPDGSRANGGRWAILTQFGFYAYFKSKETLLVGTLKGVFEDAQQKHRIRNSDP